MTTGVDHLLLSLRLTIKMIKSNQSRNPKVLDDTTDGCIVATRKCDAHHLLSDVGVEAVYVLRRIRLRVAEQSRKT